MEGGKGKDLMPYCPSSDEIAIQILVNETESDMTMQVKGGDSESASNSHSNAIDMASNGSTGVPIYSETLRRRFSSKINSDSILSELEMRRSSMTRSKFSQTKSRVMEVEQSNSSTTSNLGKTTSFSKNSLLVRIESLKKGSLPPAREHGGDDEDEDDDEDSDDEGVDDDDNDDNKKNVKNPPQKCIKRGKINLKAIDAIFEWIVFVGVMVLLIASLCVHELKIYVLWGLEIWKWSVLVAVFFCGRLVTKWTKDVIVFLIESKFLFNEKVVYFVHGVKQSVRVVIWLALVLLAWVLLVDRGVERTRDPHTIRVLNYITKALVSTLIGAVLWMLKTLLVKLIAASFHVKTFFKKIREAISHEYVLWILSMPNPKKSAEKSGGSEGVRRHCCFKFPKWRDHKEKKENEGEITIKKLGKMKPGKMPVSTMGHLIDRIRSSKLSIIACALNKNGENGAEQVEITCSCEAEEAASLIFQNVKRPNRDYIREIDLLPFMNKENADCLHEWFENVAEARKITKTALTNWAVSIYKEREFLSISLKDAKTAIEELNRILSGVVLVLIAIVWLLLMGFATTKVLLFCSSQVLLVVFIFGNSCRTLFEAMVFVFVMHPFDVGDRCVIDGVQMIVEEMDILKTTFLRYDNEMIYFPNAVLATKAIGNFNRSPERMGDAVNFDVDVSTSSESIQDLRAKIEEYIKKKSDYWHPEHSIQIKEIEDMNKMKMVLFVNHKMNFQDFLEKMNRRTELMLALKKIFEDLGIKYHLLPQEVHISYNIESALQTVLASSPPQPRSVI